jgi:phosphatidylglycerol:prolipoprotein diacylglycerol transferase
MLRVIIDFGVLKIGSWSIPLRIHGYGLMMVLGFISAILLAQWRARRAGEDPEKIAVCGILALLGGIAGARIAYVIQHWSDEFAYVPHPIRAVLDISSGGLIYYGGVVMVILLVVGYLLTRKLPVRRYLDFMAISLMVGLAFGRVGCLLNGCCFGGLCSDGWPLGMRFPMYSKPLVRLSGGNGPYSPTEDTTPAYAHQMHQGLVHPDAALLDAAGELIPPGEFDDHQVQVAEASYSLPVQPAQALGIANALIIAGVLWGFYRLRRREGQVFAAMLILYPITRFVLEDIRADNLHDLTAGLLTHNQYTSILTILIGVALLAVLHKLPASAGPAAAAREAALAGTRAAQSSDRKNRSRRRR